MPLRPDPAAQPPWQATSRSPGAAALEPLEPLDPAPRRPDPAELLAPRTQLVADREAYLHQDSHDLGRRLSADTVEMFISGDVAGALEQGFVRHAPEFVAVHDLGASASLRLLASLAGAAGRPVQKLSVRRHGQGVQLAVIQFVEMPLADGTPVRVYATDINADSQTRQQVALVLLGHSRLGVLLVGPLPPHALAAQLAPLHAAVGRPQWCNRDLLMVPLGSSTALAAQAAQLGNAARTAQTAHTAHTAHTAQATSAAGSRRLAVHVTPHAGKPRQAWAFIGGAWNRLHGSTQQHALNTDLSLAVSKVRVPMSDVPMSNAPMSDAPMSNAPTEPMQLRPGVVQAAVDARAQPAPDQQQRQQQQQLSLPPAGMLSFDKLGKPADAASAKAGEGSTTLLPAASRWQPYAERCMRIKDSVSCCVFDVPSMAPLAHAGGAPSAERLARQGALLLGHGGDAARALGLPASTAHVPMQTSAGQTANQTAHSATAEACFSTGHHHLLVRTLPGHPGVAVHLVVAASAASATGAANATNATNAGSAARVRMQLELIEVA